MESIEGSWWCKTGISDLPSCVKVLTLTGNTDNLPSVPPRPSSLSCITQVVKSFGITPAFESVLKRPQAQSCFETQMVGFPVNDIKIVQDMVPC